MTTITELVLQFNTQLTDNDVSRINDTLYDRNFMICDQEMLVITFNTQPHYRKIESYLPFWDFLLKQGRYDRKKHMLSLIAGENYCDRMIFGLPFMNGGPISGIFRHRHFFFVAHTPSSVDLSTDIQSSMIVAVKIKKDSTQVIE